ncbi:MAG: low molecular weight protein-tyrosine-phosphatase [Acidimicrobiales bacterium]
MATPTSIAFVCLGNICRSPTAKGVMQHLVDDARAGDRILVDSFGTAAYHLGEPPDSRAGAEARRRGITLDHLGQQFTPADFDRFDLVLAMDRSNAEDLRRIAPDEAAAAKVRLLREWDPDAGGDLEVPDPYYGGGDGFARVFDMVERSCRALLIELTEASEGR